MASLIPGYEYDIFISYRQKDNRGERWVSEFVEALKIELESTFKEEVSVYFDVNPHDGLLETHEVNESLKEKLKCLVFIPVISRTYCDPKSFAWQHEFKAFVENASKDQFGLKVKLSHGNVASRVLPVRIHDLESEDVQLCESMTDGVLRGIEFIYKEPGVNRPLVPDDDEKVNLNKTKYRNQINKVANAIHEIIRGLKLDISRDENQIIRNPETQYQKRNDIGGHRSILKKLITYKSVIAVLTLLFLLITVYIFFKSSEFATKEKTIAIIPLRVSKTDTVLLLDGEYFVETLTNKLNRIEKLNVKPVISTMIFRNTSKTLDQMRQELGTDFIIDGNIKRDGEMVKIWLELSESKRNKMLWSDTFILNKSTLSGVTKEIVFIILNQMQVNLSDEEKNIVDKEPSKFPDANRNYISANIIMRDAWTYFNYGHKMLDSVSFKSAIVKYDNAIAEDSLFALAYIKRAQAITWGVYNKQLDPSFSVMIKNDIQKAMHLEPDLPDIQTTLGLFYYFCEEDLEKALFYFNNAALNEPLNYQPLYYQSLAYRKMGKWEESQKILRHVIKYNPQEPLFLTNIGLSFDYMHSFDSAITFHQKAIDLVPGWPAAYINKFNSLVLKYGKSEEIKTVIEEATRNTGDAMTEQRILINMYERNYETAYNIAFNSNSSDFNFPFIRYIYLGQVSHMMGKEKMMHEYFDTSLVMMNGLLKNDPYNPLIHSNIGLCNSYNGNFNLAKEEGEKAVILSNNNKTTESDLKINLALIYLNTGDIDKAYSLVIYLLNNPSLMSGKLLSVNPVWELLLQQKENDKLLMKN